MMEKSKSRIKNCSRSTITAVVPAFNAAEFIGQALRSIFEQTRLPDEIIVVDDCSTDGTREAVRAFSNGRVRLLSTAKNSGSAEARNVGIRAARGDYVALLDADDLWLPEHCATVAGLLDKYPESALAFSRTEAFGDNSWTWPQYLEPNRVVNGFWECLERTTIPQMNMIARRAALLDIGGYRPELRQTQDFDLCLRLTYRYKIICSDQVTTHYRRHSGSITARNPFRALGGEYMARHLFWKDYQREMDAEMRDRFERAVRDIWVSHLRDAWDTSDLAALSFHLSQHELVPRSDEHYGGWVKRRRFFRFKQALGFLPAALRNRLYTALRPLLN